MHYRTAYNGYACAFSPFHENRIAVATAQNFGIIGNGRQHVLEVGALLSLSHSTCCVRQFTTLRDSAVSVGCSPTEEWLGRCGWAAQWGPMGMREVAAFDTADGLYDCAWCEVRGSHMERQRRERLLALPSHTRGATALLR